MSRLVFKIITASEKKKSRNKKINWEMFETAKTYKNGKREIQKRIPNLVLTFLVEHFCNILYLSVKNVKRSHKNVKIGVSKDLPD